MKRLENGLIDGLNYIRDEKTNKIDWFKMIPPEYLYINQDKKNQIEKRLGKTFNEIQVSEALEIELVITLQGIRWLLDTRGYKNVDIKIDAANQEYAAATCKIIFLPNEEENVEQTFTANASAHPGNTKSWYAKYLIEAASNRALCRATRNYLRVGVVSRDELGNSNEEDNNGQSSSNPQVELLQKELDKHHITFDQFKIKLVNDKVEGAENLKSLMDLSKDKIFEYLSRIKKKTSEKKEKEIKE